MVGACGSGRNPDCPNDSIYYDNSYHQILCCTVPEFNWNNCESYGSEHGVPNSCLEHGEVPTILEGTCGSGNSLIPGCNRILVVVLWVPSRFFLTFFEVCAFREQY